MAKREAVRPQLVSRGRGRGCPPGCAPRARPRRSRARDRAARGRSRRRRARSPRSRASTPPTTLEPPPYGIAARRSLAHQSSSAHDVGFAARKGDEVGRMRELAARAAHDVAVGLAVAVARRGRRARSRAARERGGRRHARRAAARVCSSRGAGATRSSGCPKRAASVRPMPSACSSLGPGALEPPAPEAAARGHRAQLPRGASASSTRRSGPGWPSGRKGWMQT